MNMERVKKLGGMLKSQGAYLTIARFIRYGLMFLFSSFCARYLGTYEYGEISYNLSQIAIIALFFTLGADSYIIIQLSRKRKEANKLISLNILNRIILVIITTLVIIIANNFVGVYRFGFVSICIYITGIMDSFRTVCDGYYQSIQEIKYLAFFELSKAITLFIGIGIVIVTKSGITGVALLYLFSSTVMFIFSFALMFKKFKVKLIKVKLIESIYIVRNSFTFFVNSIMVILSMQLDVIMLNNISGNVQTAIYLTAKKILDIILMFPAIISTIMLPKISSKEIKKEEVIEIIKKIVYLSLAIGIITILCSKYIILLAFGKEFIDSYKVLNLFALVLPCIFLNSFISTFLIGCGKEKKVLFINTFGTILNIIINFILIPKYLAFGAATATIITIVINFVQYIYYFVKTDIV